LAPPPLTQPSLLVEEKENINLSILVFSWPSSGLCEKRVKIIYPSLRRLIEIAIIIMIMQKVNIYFYY
jgi:hypothetical protein